MLPRSIHLRESTKYVHKNAQYRLEKCSMQSRGLTMISLRISGELGFCLNFCLCSSANKQTSPNLSCVGLMLQAPFYGPDIYIPLLT